MPAPTLYQCIQHSRIVSDVVLDSAFQEAFRRICADLGVEIGKPEKPEQNVGDLDKLDSRNDELDFSDILIDKSPKRGKNMSREESLSAFLRFPDEQDSMGIDPSEYAQDFPGLDVGFDLYEATFDDPLDVTVRTKFFSEKEQKAEKEKKNKPQPEQDMYAGLVVDIGARKTDQDPERSESFFEVDEKLFDLGDDENKDEEAEEEDQAALELAKLLTPETQEKFDKYLIDILIEKNAINKWQASQLCCGRSTFALGNYRIIDLLGQGGYGRVFLARPFRVLSNVGKTGAGTKDDVAIKVLPFKNAKTTEPIGKFLREVEIAKRLSNPNLVRCFESSKDASVHYCVSEYVDGGDARKLLAEHIKTKGKMHYRIAAYIIAEAAKGLAYMHQQGVVHRDIKPGNILLMKNGEVKLADFGMASVIRNFSNNSSFSTLGETIEAWELANAKTYFKSEKAVQAMKLQIQGTPDYLAPDQLSPEGVQKPSPLWDVYSLGCSLYFMLTGVLPYPCEGSIEKLRVLLYGSVPPEPIEYDQTLPRELSRLTMHMMEKNPHERAKYVRSANIVVETLKRWVPYDRIEDYRWGFLRSGDNFWSDEHLDKIFQSNFSSHKSGVGVGRIDDGSSRSKSHSYSSSGSITPTSSFGVELEPSGSKQTAPNPAPNPPKEPVRTPDASSRPSPPLKSPTPPPVVIMKNDREEEIARLENRNSRLIKFVLAPLLGLTLVALVVAIIALFS